MVMSSPFTPVSMAAPPVAPALLIIGARFEVGANDTASGKGGRGALGPRGDGAACDAAR